MTCGKHFEVFFSVYLQMKIKNLHEKNICFGLSSEIITVSLRNLFKIQKMICLITIHSILIQQIAIIFFIFNLIPRAPGMMNRETMFLSSLPFSM